MNELSRMRYLDALGIDSYVSRTQLPGAATTCRLAIVRRDAPGPASAEAGPVAAMPRATLARAPADLGAMLPDAAAGFDREPVQSPSPPKAAPVRAEAVRFSLAAIFVGQVAWVEVLDNNPLAQEQVQLVHAMARAVSGEVGRPDVTQFDWPTHQNHQLDLGPEAARAGVAGFLQRQIEQRKCRGLVLLGGECESRVELARLGAVNAVVTDSTLAMLREPLRKRQVWQDLQPLVLRV